MTFMTLGGSMSNITRRATLCGLAAASVAACDQPFRGGTKAIVEETTYAPALTLAERLVGSWNLVSAEGHSSDGKITYDWGPKPLGLLIYDANGRMSVHLLNPTRRQFASGDFLRPTPEELQEAFDGYFGYFGTYSVDENAGVVTHHVEGAAYPNYIGTAQRRFVVLEGTRLTLRTPPERAGGADVTYLVTFERIR